MKYKKFLLPILAILIIASGVFVGKVLSNYNYDYLYYNERYYIVIDELVKEEQIETELGCVKRNIFIKPVVGNENGDSNLLTEGTSIYKLKNVSEQENLTAWYDGGYRKICVIKNQQ